MNVSLPVNPTTALPVLGHLATWGEVAICELKNFGAAAPWLEVFREAGLVAEAKEPDGKALSWFLIYKGEALMDAQPEATLRLALFQVPGYRDYLLGILAEGLVLAAKADLREQLEAWTREKMAAILTEVNSILDTIEAEQGRLVDVTAAEIDQRFAHLPQRQQDWRAWDQFLLGRSGRAQDLFDFVLKRFAPISTLPETPGADQKVVVLRPLPLSLDGEDLAKAWIPSGWNLRRHRVYGGLALLDEHGRALQPVVQGNFEAKLAILQDALLEHPFHHTIVQLAIAAWRAPAASLSEVELYLPPGKPFSEVALLCDGRETGTMCSLLPQLVSAQGYRVRGLPDNVIPPELMDNVFNNLMTLNLLRLKDDTLMLHPDFQASLMANRLRRIFQPGKALQQRLLKILEDRFNEPHAMEMEP